MLLRDVAGAGADVRATASRTAKVERLATALRALGPEEVEAGCAFLAGEVRQRQTGVGWRSLRELPPPAAEATLTVAEVDAALARIAATAGAGSQAARRAELR